MSRLDQVVEGSPCDETEVVWVEIFRSEVGSGPSRPPFQPHSETTVLIRVREGGRIGSYRTAGGSVGELSAAVRQALSHARIQPPAPWICPPAGSEERCEPPRDLVDRELAALEPERARSELHKRVRNGETAWLAWSVGRVLVANSRGLRQQAAATSATCRLQQRRQPGTGRVTVSARSLEGLSLDAAFERLRFAGAPISPPAGEWKPEGPIPVVLSPEATAALVQQLGVRALSADSFKTGTSWLCGRLDERLLDADLTLLDDATDPRGLPFPFDLLGYATRPVEMIRSGVAVTPAVDGELSQRLGRPPTPHAASGGEHRPGHLFLAPGDLDQAELLRRAEGGVWIGCLDRLAVVGSGGSFRALARGMRRIAGGELVEAVRDQIWEDSLPRVFADLAGIGRQPVCIATEDGFLGSVSAPALALPPVAGLRPAKE